MSGKNFAIAVYDGKQHDHPAGRKIDNVPFGHPSSSLCGRGIDLGDLAQTISLGVVRTGNERSARLCRVPAGHDTESERLFSLDVTRREILHLVSFGLDVRA